MGPSMTVEGSTTKEVFEAYLEQVLLPEVREGQVLISWTSYRLTSRTG
jgi:hypothetical protein